jgi:hypothetical protein
MILELSCPDWNQVRGRHRTYRTCTTYGAYSGGGRAPVGVASHQPPPSAYRLLLTTRRLSAAGSAGAPPNAY